MRLFKPVLALLFVLVLAACDNKPLPPDKVAYVGQWAGPDMRLMIKQDGSVAYQRREGSSNTSINAPLKEFAGNNLVVGVGPMTTTFVVTAPPHQVGTQWKMTVDGVELTKEPDAWL
ncbi:MAG: hypothetical protein V4631_02375 [Pseudomonadota bacterium]